MKLFKITLFILLFLISICIAYNDYNTIYGGIKQSLYKKTKEFFSKTLETDPIKNENRLLTKTLGTCYNPDGFNNFNPDKVIPNNWCRVDGSRSCQQGKIKCPANETELLKAEKYAFGKLCIEKGHCFVVDPEDEFKYTCEFTKNTCLAASEKIVDNNRKFNSENDEDKPEKYPYTEWRDKSGCIKGNKLFKDFCVNDNPCGMGEWNYNRDNGLCRLGSGYCDEMGLKLEGGECTERVGQTFAEALIGKTLYRGDCPRYADIWDDTDKEDWGKKIIQEKCLFPE
jgi:hypothetical protein